MNRSPFTIVGSSGRALSVGGQTTRLMAVLNITPDSFSDGGQHMDQEHAVARGLELVAEGADLLDLGGESTRPGYVAVPADLQLRRVLPVLKRLRRAVNVPLSVDTTSAEVAVAALDAGADWINDTSALTFDPSMAEVVRKAGCPVVLMHRFTPPRTLPEDPPETVLSPLVHALSARVEAALEAGIDRRNLVLDPGLGFGTTVSDSVFLLSNAAGLKSLGLPLLFGPSRKSFLGHLTGRPVEDRLSATAAAVAACVAARVEIVRVHDVAAMQDVVKVMDAVVAARSLPVR